QRELSQLRQQADMVRAPAPVRGRARKVRAVCIEARRSRILNVLVWRRWLTMVEVDGRKTSCVAKFASPPRFDTVITIFLALAGWHSGLAKISDNSFFCHLGTGQWILEHGI